MRPTTEKQQVVNRQWRLITLTNSRPLLKACQRAGVCLMKRLARRKAVEVATSKAAAQRDGGKIIIHSQFGIAPIALIGLVADGEVETAKAGFDRMAEQLIQMRAPRTEARELAVVIARYDEIVAVAKPQTEIGRGDRRADIEPAHMGKVVKVRIGGDGLEELAIARPREDVLDTHMGERVRFLVEQRRQCALAIGPVHVDEADLAILAKLLELLAFLLPGRGGTLSGVERVPIAAELRDIGAARMRKHRQMDEGIGLRPHRLRHLLQIDAIEAETWVRVQCGNHLMPEGDETLGVDLLEKTRVQQRRIVIAEIGAEPGQAAEQAATLDRQLQDEEQAATLVAPHDYRGHGAFARADMALPGREKAVGLEHGAVGVALEGFPLRLGHG